jgi:hypothetical protein
MMRSKLDYHVNAATTGTALSAKANKAQGDTDLLLL